MKAAQGFQGWLSHLTFDSDFSPDGYMSKISLNTVTEARCVAKEYLHGFPERLFCEAVEVKS